MWRVRLATISLCVITALGGCVVDETRTEALREQREAAPPTLPSNPIASPIMQSPASARTSARNATSTSVEICVRYGAKESWSQRPMAQPSRDKKRNPT